VLVCPVLRTPPVVQVNAVRIGQVCTALWLIAVVVLGVLHTTLSRHHEVWWFWTAVAGAALGVLGLGWMTLRGSRLGGGLGTGRTGVRVTEGPL
jgi:hypothetical protein